MNQLKFFFALGSILTLEKLTFFCFLKMQSLHKLYSTNINHSSFPFNECIFIPFSLMCPNLKFHKSKLKLSSTTTIVSLQLKVIYSVLVLFPWATTMAPSMTFHTPLVNVTYDPHHQVVLLRPSYILTLLHVLSLYDIFNLTSPTMFKCSLLAKYTFPYFPIT